MITIEEMRQDYGNTLHDINALQKAVDGIELFTTHSGGEDRSGFRMDLFKYKSLLSQARALADTIEAKMISEYGVTP
jgi:hypothetical protein